MRDDDAVRFSIKFSQQIAEIYGNSQLALLKIVFIRLFSMSFSVSENQKE
jgi:hypothetical protein